MDLYSLCTVLLVLLITWFLAKFKKMMSEKTKLPPGPTPFPIIGTMYKMNIKNILHSLVELQKSYGDIYTIYEGNRPCIVLCGYKAIKETLIDQADEFSGRCYYPAFSDFTKADEMFSSNGEKWKELRRFTISTLTNFGMGKRSIEERIKEEASYFFDIMRNSKGSPINPKQHLHRSISNIICYVMFGNRFNYEDKEFQKFVHCIQDIYHVMSSAWGLLYNTYPKILKYIPGPHQQMMKNYSYAAEFINKRVEKNIKVLDSNNPNDFIDCFLIKMAKEEKNDNTYYTCHTLTMCVLTLVFAGTETTGNTLCYLFLLLLKHPDVAEKVCQEVDNVIGQRSPNYEDRHKMPYTEAFIHEVQRFADVVPLSLPHELTRDTEVLNYTFQKGTMFMPLLSTVLKDKTQFNNPECFNPNNFLDENGKFKKTNAFVAFSAGKRVCPGSSMAVMEIFLYVTLMLQNFTIKSPVPTEEISIASVTSGLIQIVPNYEFCVFPRTCSEK